MAHRGHGEISSWIAAWGCARPLKAALGGELVFRLAATRYRGRGKDLRRYPSKDPVAERSLRLAQRTQASRGVDAQKSSPLTHQRTQSVDSGLRPECWPTDRMVR
jgi:hypothetical protein